MFSQAEHVPGRDVSRSFPDRQLLQAATSQARTVITRDLDFGDLGIRQGLASTGVIILRYHRRDLPSITARLLHVVADCGERLTGSLAVVQVERSRVIALAPGNPEHR